MSDTLRRRIAAGLLIVGVVVAVLAIEDVGAQPRTVLLLSADGDWRISDPG